MSSVNFGGPLDFGSATYSEALIRQASNDAIPADANITAVIVSENSYFTVTAITSYAISLVPVPPVDGDGPAGRKINQPKQKVYREVGQSDGTTPLHVRKGQAVYVSVSLDVPSTSVTPGLTAAKLMITGDSWATPTAVDLRAYLVAVDESTPLGQKWDARGGLPASGAVLANTQPMPDGVGSYQPFANGAIVYSPDFGAVWLTEPVYAKLNSASVSQTQTATGAVIADYLGYPTGDTTATVEAGGEMTIFERGMIVLRASGTSWVVYGPIYGHYTGLGSIISGAANVPVVGLPASDEVSAPGGRCSHFDGGDIYWKPATGAWEVHGAIRERWNALGGPSGFVGYPTSDETPVMSGTSEVGRFNTFEGGIRVAATGGLQTGQVRIYWSPVTGAFEVYGAIRAHYLDSGGPAGGLGFPTSGEADTTGGGRFNAFQHGLIVWHPTGPYSGVYTVGNQLKLNLYSYQDTAHDDFNVQINIIDANGQVNHGRMPPSDNYGNGNQQFNPPVTLMTANAVTPPYTMDVWMLCIHENTIGADDEDGTVTAHYDIDNLWGTADSPMHSNTSFNVNMKPMPEPQIYSTDPAQFRTQLFWPFHNFDTDPLSWTEFSETYTNVGEGDLAFNILPWNWHLWERAFFQFVYRTLAKGGNCFGMCLESIYARESRTMFVEPIYNSPDNTYSKDPLGVDPTPLNPNDAVVVEQINIKVGYQLGSDFIAWFLAMETSNNTQDAVLAFKTSRDAFAAGNWPMIPIASSALSQDGHAVVPYQWLVSFGGAPPIPASDEAIDSQPLSNQAWIIRVANPNAPPNNYADDNAECEILIDPLENSWSFKKGDTTQWTGSAGAGRIFCAPFSLLSYEQAMIGDLIIGLLEGLAVVIFSSDGQTEQITDEIGRTYFTYQEPETASVIAPLTRPPGMRQINRAAKTRIPDITFVPTYNRTTQAGSESSALPFEIYYIRRPTAGYQWAGAHAVAVIEPSVTPQAKVPDLLLHPDPNKPRLNFDLKVDRRSGYRWNLNCPRMSVDIASDVPTDVVDHVSIINMGGGSQTVELTADTTTKGRIFDITVAGWRGNYGSETKVYALKEIALEGGSSLVAGVNDGGRELWIHNPGNAITFTLELYVGTMSQPAFTKVGAGVATGGFCRIRPSNWDAKRIVNATIYQDLFDTTGKFLSRIEL